MRADMILASRDADSEALVWSPAEFEAKLRERGRSYHIHHPFNVMLNSGQATPEQVRGWVANRFYYQIAIPVKDAAVLSNCPDREVRRGWVLRILDHDGFEITAADGACRLSAETQSHHFIVGPEGAIDHHAVRAAHGVEQIGRAHV